MLRPAIARSADSSGPGAGDDQPLRGKRVERPHHRVDVLVREQARDAEHEAGLDPVGGLHRALRCERRRRRDDLGLDAVDRLDTLRHDGRVREVPVGGGGRGAVPPLQRPLQRGRGGTNRAGTPAEVAVGLVKPARRRVAVHDLPTLDARPVRPAARAADDDVGLDPQAGERRGEERQGGAMVAPERTHTVDRQRSHLDRPELGERALRVVERGEERGPREGAGEREDDALGTAPLGQVVVDERHRHLSDSPFRALRPGPHHVPSERPRREETDDAARPPR